MRFSQLVPWKHECFQGTSWENRVMYGGFYQHTRVYNKYVGIPICTDMHIVGKDQIEKESIYALKIIRPIRDLNP